MSRPPARLAAVATTDPFDRRTFSGYSAALFRTFTSRGFPVVPIASRHVRARDLLGGALHLRGLARGRLRGRRAPRIDPDWYWSTPVLERSSARVNTRIDADADITHVLQIGTHVRIDRPGVRAFCLTDCTVVQALEADEFAVSHASPAGRDRAIAWQREVFASCETIFTTSRWAARSIVEDYGQSPDRIRVVGAGATNVAPNGPVGEDHRDPTVLFVGYDWELKGGPVLLDAWRRVRARIPDAELVVVGCRPRIDEPGVRVLGPLDPRRPDQRSRLIDAYATARCLVLASDFDAYGIVVLEAGAMGLPVVAFDEGCRRELVLHGQTGVLVQGHRADSLARGLHRLLDDPGLAARMGRRGAARVAAGFTWDHVADRVGDAMGLAR